MMGETHADLAGGLTLFVLLSLLLAVHVDLCVGAERDGRAILSDGRFDIRDYGQLRRFADLVASSDGRELAFVMSSRNGSRLTAAEQRRSGSRVYVVEARPSGKLKEVPRLAGAKELEWIPGTHVLAALLPQGGHAAVYLFNLESGSASALTEASGDIVYFQFSNDGAVAYITRGMLPLTSTIYWRVSHGSSGFIVDPDRTVGSTFYDPFWWQERIEPNGGGGELWIARQGEAVLRGRVPGAVRSFSWSPSSKELAVTYVANDVPRLGPPFQAEETSVGLVNAADGTFRAIAEGTGKSDNRPAVWYSAGLWTRDGRGLALLRMVERDWWYSATYPQWAMIYPERSSEVPQRTWRQIQAAQEGGLISSGAAGTYLPVDQDTVLVATPVGGRANLYAFRGRDSATPLAMVRFAGDATDFAFDKNETVVAFVGQSLTRPPELYLVGRHGVPIRITGVNENALGAVRYRSVEVHWRGADGTSVSGWLLEPYGKPPWPLLTFVHGGPLHPMTASFAAYFNDWPYPLEVFASHGIAVFEPNYRGTWGFGRQSIPRDLAGQPVLDIILGIEHLEDAGIADARRLGICGQSHGAWLGALVMERSAGFKAASFAEGSEDVTQNYLEMSGFGNREINDAAFGANYYNDPYRYLEISADLNLRGTTTPMLLEAGGWGHPEMSLSMAKAARYFGEPVELVIYPRTEHNITDPLLADESASRNYAWFEFWLRGNEFDKERLGKEIAQWNFWRKKAVPN